MITVDLVGGIRKAAGFSTVNINVTNSSVNELLTLLEREYDLENKIKEDEIMIAINGVESSVMGGRGAKISSGDTVTILSVVHGG
ncbi:MAG TPA: MoaD/ThiS family protein [Candidatus Nitrosocosmicus sp.]|uniref:ThiS family protein n=1 Tax=Candidatus Nitrosocosmicus oleophilus TaxID=1353260 RepID=A0A654M4I0_9ARCH|nr:MoaD/ThiS family protein [Candidatus Nitrosocosmicus oleophilus]ALI37511.1 ThiS family protein [Candidatus Nitrosocosmicus oleophilus]HKU83649.1 MoaD/ThiS family protein [Candidatus Nitrosocosmicus sp.]